MQTKVRIFLVVILTLANWASVSEAVHSNEKAKEAFEDIKLKAEQGDAEAQLELAVMYGWGQGTELDNDKYAYWRNEAAENGNIKAQYLITRSFLSEKPPNTKKYLQSMEELANQGYCDAIRSLGDEYFSGDKLPLNYSKSKEWYKNGVENDCLNCLESLGDFFKSDSYGTKQDAEKFENLILEAANRGSTSAMFSLYTEYQYGQTLEKNGEKAFKWALAYAEDMKNSHSFEAVAEMLDEGEGTQQNYKEAAKWYIRSTDENLFSPSISAMSRLGEMYSEGLGVLQDYSEAFKWHTKAAQADWHYSQYHLARMYDKGRGTTKSLKKAHLWYTKAANNGIPEAMNNLGVQFEFGLGTLQDYTKAHMWYNLAAFYDIEVAIENRQRLTKLMTPEQLAESQRMARDLQKEHEYDIGW